MKNKKLIRTDVVSNSMFPIIRAGDIIFAAPCKNPRMGDIVIFKLNKKVISGDRKVGYLVHRVIGTKMIKNKKCFVEKGDHCTPAWGFQDTPIGKVIKVQHNGHIVNLNERRWKLYNKRMTLLSLLEYKVYTLTDPLFRMLPQNMNKRYRRFFSRSLNQIKVFSRKLIIKNCV